MEAAMKKTVLENCCGNLKKAVATFLHSRQNLLKI